jgi:putative transposase
MAPGEEDRMKKSRYTEEQIVGVLKGSKAGVETGELCRKHGISQQTFYHWKAKYGGLEVSEAQRLRHLEEENRKLKQLVAAPTRPNQTWTMAFTASSARSA